uniref:Uncharacterized protein n=2 Tax=Roseolovirus TaxID=40272 RepID=A0A1W6GAG6_9BETA|nr:hypothetical protein [Human betaherpesvirus 6]AVI07523.1 hypothetical protein [Human betaherpesvirus 6B]ARK01878.1 hypothetical protein [Human betaherpesvirus 6]ARK02130.1 hypothetical protein [Human betaherpesvirus 6]ARK02710.1 hypothetical protein [Human betaherpesvirus 6]
MFVVVLRRQWKVTVDPISYTKEGLVSGRGTKCALMIIHRSGNNRSIKGLIVYTCAK